MTEQQQFIAMLARAGVGYGLRDDHNPPGTSVQVEIDDDKAKHGWTVAEFGFDDTGTLNGVSVYAGEPG